MQKNVKQPEDRNILIKDIIQDNVDDSFFIKNRNIKGKNALDKLRKSERNLDGKFKCLTTSGQSGTSAGATTIRLKNGDLRIPTPEECELAQTIPLNYTKHVSKTQRYKCLGNGWTVDVIVHILKNIQNCDNT